MDATTSVFDGHNDLAWKVRELGPHTSLDLDIDRPHLHTDLPRLRRGGVRAQFWSVFVPGSQSEPSALRGVIEQINLVQRIVASNPHALQLARTPGDVMAAWERGRIASLMGAEGGRCIGGSIQTLRLLSRLGVSYLTLTHNESLSWADSATDVPIAGGLDDRGEEIVDEMNALGMIVDLSHVASSTMRDALDRSRAPIMFSHSSCHAVTAHPRNVPDDILGRLPTNGGICMVTFVPPFVSQRVADWYEERRCISNRAGTAELEAWTRAHPCPTATVRDVADHVEHVREVAGIHHVGIGGDFDGSDTTPIGLADVGGYPALFAELTDRGWSPSDLESLGSRNMLRVLGDVVGSARR
jgi:membrane dipeptidase